MLYQRGKGRFQEEYDHLCDEEFDNDRPDNVLFAIVSLAHEYYVNGNMNWVYSQTDFVGLVELLKRHLVPGLRESDHSVVSDDLDRILHYGRTGQSDYREGRDEFDRMIDRVVIWYQETAE